MTPQQQAHKEAEEAALFYLGEGSLTEGGLTAFEFGAEWQREKDAATLTALREENERLRNGLENAKRHLEITLGQSTLQLSSLYRMVCAALTSNEQRG